jgi:hypothetical protein
MRLLSSLFLMLAAACLFWFVGESNSDRYHTASIHEEVPGDKAGAPFQVPATRKQISEQDRSSDQRQRNHVTVAEKGPIVLSGLALDSNGKAAAGLMIQARSRTEDQYRDDMGSLGAVRFPNPEQLGLLGFVVADEEGRFRIELSTTERCVALGGSGWVRSVTGPPLRAYEAFHYRGPFGRSLGDIVVRVQGAPTLLISYNGFPVGAASEQLVVVCYPKSGSSYPTIASDVEVGRGATIPLSKGEYRVVLIPCSGQYMIESRLVSVTGVTRLVCDLRVAATKEFVVMTAGEMPVSEARVSVFEQDTSTHFRAETGAIVSDYWQVSRGGHFTYPEYTASSAGASMQRALYGVKTYEARSSKLGLVQLRRRYAKDEWWLRIEATGFLPKTIRGEAIQNRLRLDRGATVNLSSRSWGDAQLFETPLVVHLVRVEDGNQMATIRVPVRLDQMGRGKATNLTEGAWIVEFRGKSISPISKVDGEVSEICIDWSAVRAGRIEISWGGAGVPELVGATSRRREALRGVSDGRVYKSRWLPSGSYFVRASLGDSVGPVLKKVVVASGTVSRIVIGKVEHGLRLRFVRSDGSPWGSGEVVMRDDYGWRKIVRADRHGFATLDGARPVKFKVSGSLYRLSNLEIRDLSASYVSDWELRDEGRGFVEVVVPEDVR